MVPTLRLFYPARRELVVVTDLTTAMLGIEANYSFLDNGSNNNTGFFGAGNPFANRGVGSVTGRLGYTFGPAMIYAKGGYAYADTCFTNGFGGNMGRDGYTVGGGLEYLFTRNCTAAIIYRNSTWVRKDRISVLRFWSRHLYERCWRCLRRWTQRRAYRQGWPKLPLQPWWRDARQRLLISQTSNVHRMARPAEPDLANFVFCVTSEDHSSHRKTTLSSNDTTQLMRRTVRV